MELLISRVHSSASTILGGDRAGPQQPKNVCDQLSNGSWIRVLGKKGFSKKVLLEEFVSL